MVLEKAKEKEILESEAFKIISSNTRMIRALEQRFNILEMRVRGIEEKIVSEIGELKKNLDKINIDIKAIRENLTGMQEEILKINRSLDKTARKAEVKELESLLEFYNPIKSKFITREEAERLIEEKLSEKTT